MNVLNCKNSCELRLISDDSIARAVCVEGTGERVVSSEDLLQGRRGLFILHNGCVYRLLKTRNNKLILQK
jgi:hemin uptake protein HemP